MKHGRQQTKLAITSCFLILGIGLPSSAQGNSLQSPLLAINTATHDKIILYDVTNDSYRQLQLGDFWHYVWGFSPDGCSVLFTLGEENSLGKLYRMNLDGSNVQPLVNYEDLPAEQWWIWEPQWSPDGERIAFTMIRDGLTNKRQYHIAWIPAGGGEPDFYSVTGHEHEPQWSPDGAWLAYISIEERTPGADANATATPQEEIDKANLPKRKEADIWVVSSDGTTKYPLTAFVTGSATKPRWSPDSSVLAFSYAPSGNNDTVWTVPNQPNGFQLAQQLTQQESLVLDLTWIPSGTAVVGAIRDFNSIRANQLWQIPLFPNADAAAIPMMTEFDAQYTDYPRFHTEGEWFIARSAYELLLVNRIQNRFQLLDPITIGNTPTIWSPSSFQGESNCA